MTSGKGSGWGKIALKLFGPLRADPLTQLLLEHLRLIIALYAGHELTRFEEWLGFSPLERDILTVLWFILVIALLWKFFEHHIAHLVLRLMFMALFGVATLVVFLSGQPHSSDVAEYIRIVIQGVLASLRPLQLGI